MSKHLTDIAKVFAVMCAWALLCRLGLEFVPANPWPIGIYAAISLLGFAWVVPAAMFNFHTANYVLRLTFGIWVATALFAGLLAIAIGGLF